MKTLLVEDKAYIRKGLLNLLNLIESEVEVIGECESVKEAVVVANACKPDLIFLDINLTDGNAFEFLDQTEHLKFKIIFITAYEEYALKALKIGAVDYILKPVDINDLEIALIKVSNLSKLISWQISFIFFIDFNSLVSFAFFMKPHLFL